MEVASSQEGRVGSSRARRKSGEERKVLSPYIEDTDAASSLIPEDSSRPASAHNLALSLHKQRMVETATRLHRQTLEAKAEKQRKEHHEGAWAGMGHRQALASDSQHKSQESTEVERVLREKSERRKQALGEYHPRTLASMSDLATVLFQQGRNEEAEALFRQILEKHEGRLSLKQHEEMFPGKKDPNKPSGKEDANKTMRRLAVVLHEQGKHEEAEMMQRKVRLLALQSQPVQPRG